MGNMAVFFRQEQSCTEANSYSPSAGKPAMVMQDWEKHFPGRMEVHSFEPATREQLYLAHDHAYVDGVLDCKQFNGFDNASPAIAESLLYTTGSMIAAAKEVLEDGTFHRCAVSPTSGFHHAHYSYGGGFCTFNGLMVTAIEMYRLGLAKRILILDFDQHYGDGTQNIIDRLGIDYVDHITGGMSYETGEEGLVQLQDLMRLPVGYYDLVLYQAGADIHVDDPLGGRMTTDQMHTRDGLVFGYCRMRFAPVVWNLAGGYQRDLNGTIEPVLALHRQTMDQCLRVYP